MSASSSLFLTVALASLLTYANTLKCWNGSDRIEQMPKMKTQCEPGTVSCTKVHCRLKTFEHTVMGCHQPNTVHCDDGYLQVKSLKCIKQCCRGDFCNDLSDTWPPADWSSEVIGLHTSFGICCIVFAVLIAAVFSAEFVN